MNFEHLCKTIINNMHRIRNLDRTLWFIKYNYEGFKIRKRRMKLGSIAFDIIDTTFSEVLLRQDVEIRYTRQDNTEADELKLENRLKALNWKWDYSNILAFLIIATFLIIVIYSFFYMWYCNNLPEFAYRNKKYDILVDRSIKILMIDSTLAGMPFVLFSNIIDRKSVV